MSQSPLLTVRAMDDVRTARDHYDEQPVDGLSDRFGADLDHALTMIAAFPESGSPLHREVRRVLLRRFPYAVFYRLTGPRIEVLAVLHTSRDPERWP